MKSRVPVVSQMRSSRPKPMLGCECSPSSTVRRHPRNSTTTSNSTMGTSCAHCKTEVWSLLISLAIAALVMVALVAYASWFVLRSWRNATRIGRAFGIGVAVVAVCHVSIRAAVNHSLFEAAMAPPGILFSGGLAMRLTSWIERRRHPDEAR